MTIVIEVPSLKVLSVTSEYVGLMFTLRGTFGTPTDRAIPLPLEALAQSADTPALAEELRRMIRPRALNEDEMLVRELFEQVDQFPKKK